jgi:hypothetical protein
VMSPRLRKSSPISTRERLGRMLEAGNDAPVPVDFGHW